MFIIDECIGEVQRLVMFEAQKGNKMYYEATKETVNYGELYEKFIQVCEEVMQLGLK